MLTSANRSLGRSQQLKGPVGPDPELLSGILRLTITESVGVEASALTSSAAIDFDDDADTTSAPRFHAGPVVSWDHTRSFRITPDMRVVRLSLKDADTSFSSFPLCTCAGDDEVNHSSTLNSPASTGGSVLATAVVDIAQLTAPICPGRTAAQAAHTWSGVSNLTIPLSLTSPPPPRTADPSALLDKAAASALAADRSASPHGARVAPQGPIRAPAPLTTVAIQRTATASASAAPGAGAGGVPRTGTRRALGPPGALPAKGPWQPFEYGTSPPPTAPVPLAPAQQAGVLAAGQTQTLPLAQTQAQAQARNKDAHSHALGNAARGGAHGGVRGGGARSGGGDVEEGSITPGGPDDDGGARGGGHIIYDDAEEEDEADELAALAGLPPARRAMPPRRTGAARAAPAAPAEPTPVALTVTDMTPALTPSHPAPLFAAAAPPTAAAAAAAAAGGPGAAGGPTARAPAAAAASRAVAVANAGSDLRTLLTSQFQSAVPTTVYTDLPPYVTVRAVFVSDRKRRLALQIFTALDVQRRGYLRRPEVDVFLAANGYPTPGGYIWRRFCPDPTAEVVVDTEYAGAAAGGARTTVTDVVTPANFAAFLEEFSVRKIETMAAKVDAHLSS